MSKLRDEILNNSDLETQEFDWSGKKVLIREMNGEERARIMGSMPKDEDKIDPLKLSVDMVIACVCDPESSENLFTDKDVDLLRKKNPRILQEITDIAMRLSGLKEEAMGEAVKN